MVKQYTLEPTKNPGLFRVVDMNGDWTHYLYAAPGTDPRESKVFLRSVNDILEHGYPKDTRFEQWLLRTLPQKREEIMRYACEKGRSIHHMIDELIQEDNMPTNLAASENMRHQAILSFVRFWELHAPVIITSEYPILNFDLEYAGTLDAILKLTKCCGKALCPCKEIIGKLGVWDWKTGSRIKQEHFAQVGAYKNGKNVKEILPKGMTVEYGAILRIMAPHADRNTYQLKTAVGKRFDECFEQFLAAKTIAGFSYKGFDPDIITI
jgi:hypothetical protein